MKKSIIALVFFLFVAEPVMAVDGPEYDEAPLKKESHETIKTTKYKLPNIRIFSEQQTIQINSFADWLDFVTNSKSIDQAIININVDLDFTNQNYLMTTIINESVVIEGNNHTFSNFKKTTNFIDLNRGQIKNLNFNNININTTANYSALIKENYGLLENISVNKAYFKGNYYVGMVAKNYGTITNIRLNDFNLVGNRYVGSVAGLNTNYHNGLDLMTFYSTATIDKVIMQNIKIRSIPFVEKKNYRTKATSNTDVFGDYMGGLVGKNNNASILNSAVYNINMYGDDYLGGIVGFNAYNVENDNFALVENINVKNLKIYGGIRIGGIVGYNVSYEPINLKRIAPNSTRNNEIKALLNKATLTENLFISAHSEAGGAVGLNYSAKITNVGIKVNEQKYNVYTHYDEAAGLVADNEFGYVKNSFSTANVKAKIFQAAGFCADNEGTIINSQSYGIVYTTKEAGGFVGSNLGQVIGITTYSNVYTTKQIKVITYKKIKEKETNKKNKKKKKPKYKKIVKYYPQYSGNIAAYNGKVTYKGLKLIGKVSKSKYYGKRYLKNKLMPNRAYGAYGK